MLTPRYPSFLELTEKVFRAIRERRLLATIQRFHANRRKLLTRDVLGWYGDPEVVAARERLQGLGLRRAAYNELKLMSETATAPRRRIAAAWSLAVWEANRQCRTGALECLQMLGLLEHDPRIARYSRALPILKAECLQLLGDPDHARVVLQRYPGDRTDVNLILAKANLANTEAERIEGLNQAFAVQGLAKVTLETDSHSPPFDRLRAVGSGDLSLDRRNQEQPLVTVIVPAFNASDTIATALTSLLAQTWRRLEILVVDDCSTDDTAERVAGIRCQDERVRLIRAPVNAGPYVARNLALQQARGEFVTCHDADDWSHPQKVDLQVRHLQSNAGVIANMSEQVRATPDLTFDRRGQPGFYVFQNMSSLMFRRKPVSDALGYWDCVRFGSDSEFIQRLRCRFGESAVAVVRTGPVTLQRQAPGSLTSSSKFGYPNFFMGARFEYRQAQIHHHKQADTLYYPYPQADRPFPVPEPLRPNREVKKDAVRRFDVVVASDFREGSDALPGCLDEVAALADAAGRIGLVQMYRYDLPPGNHIDHAIRLALEDGLAEMLVYGERIHTRSLVLLHPPAFQEAQVYVPEITAEEVHLVADQPPRKADADDATPPLYDLTAVLTTVAETFGGAAAVHPVSETVRTALRDNLPPEMADIEMPPRNWSHARKQLRARMKAGLSRAGDH